MALRLADHTRLHARLSQQGQVILALDGLQPYKGQDVLWILRDCLSGEVLLARSLDSTREADLAELLRSVTDTLPVPICAVISDAERPVRLAVQHVLPGVPHQLCQFHYLKEVAKPITTADHHAMTELRKCIRGVRAIEHMLAGRDDAAASRGYCLAVRSALRDDGKPPLQPPGLTLYTRLTAIHASLVRVRKKGVSHPNWGTFRPSWPAACSRRPTSGHPSRQHTPGSSTRHRCLPTPTVRTG